MFYNFWMENVIFRPYGRILLPAEAIFRPRDVVSHVIESRDLLWVMFVPTQHPIFTPGPDNRWCSYIIFCCLQVLGVSVACR